MWYLLAAIATTVSIWVAVWAFAFVMVYGALVLERVGQWVGVSNCLFFAVRRFVAARRDPTRHHVALIVQWSSRYWGPHVWFCRHVQGIEAEEYIPKLQRRLVRPTIVFRGRVRRKREKS